MARMTTELMDQEAAQLLIDTRGGMKQRGQPIFHDLQREALLAAVPVAGNTGADITGQFGTREPGWIDLDRLQFVVAPTLAAAAGVVDGGRLTAQSRLVVLSAYGLTSAPILRNSGGNPRYPLATFDPLRPVERMRLGQMRLEPGETLDWTVRCDVLDSAGNPIAVQVSACAPFVPDRYAGQSVFLGKSQAVAANDAAWNSSGPWQMLGNTNAAFVAAGTTYSAGHPEAGWSDGTRMDIQADRDGLANLVATYDWLATISNIAGPIATSDNLIQGLAGARAPAAVFHPMRLRNWVRLGFWYAPAQQAWSVTLQDNYSAVAGRASFGVPFMAPGYGGIGKVPSDCSCKCEC